MYFNIIVSTLVFSLVAQAEKIQVSYNEDQQGYANVVVTADDSYVKNFGTDGYTCDSQNGNDGSMIITDKNKFLDTSRDYLALVENCKSKFVYVHNIENDSNDDFQTVQWSTELHEFASKYPNDLVELDVSVSSHSDFAAAAKTSVRRMAEENNKDFGRLVENEMQR
eukprot:Pgem_evm2s9184